MDRSALHSVPLPIVVIERTELSVSFANAAFRQATGFSADDLPPAGAWWRPAGAGTDDVSDWGGLLSDGPAGAVVRRGVVRCRDGGERAFEAHAVAATDATDAVVVTFLPEHGATYNRALFETLPIGLALCRLDGSLVDVNQAYADILGRSIDETLSLTYWDITPRSYEAREGEQLKSLNGTGHYGPYEKEYLHKNGSRVPVRLQGELIELDGETYIWSSVENIADRVRAEQDLAASVQLAEQASRAKTEFLANMSHELRTPLNAVIGFSEFLRVNPRESLSDKQVEYVDHIIAAGRHLLDLVNDVLDITKVESGKAELAIEDVSIHHLVDECLEMSAPAAGERKVDLVNALASDSDLTVRADEVRLRQVLLNLLSNATKYNRPGGSVVVEAHRLSPEMVFVGVRDTGIGIPHHLHGRVFEPFDRLDPKTASAVEGTGVGLTVCRQLVRKMGGAIGFESSPGTGSRFWFTLPAA